MVSHWSLSDSKSSQVTRTLRSIMVDLKNAVVWMVSTGPLISKSSSPIINPLVTVPIAPITIGITVTFMFYIFQFSSKVLVLISLFTFFQFYPAISRNGKVNYSAGSLCFCWLSLSLVVLPIFDDPFVYQNPREFSTSHPPGRTPGWTYTTCSYSQI